MGVTIYKPGQKHPEEGLSFEERQLKARQERRRRIEEHHERDRAYQREMSGEKAAPGPPENKMETPDQAVPENKATPPRQVDVSALSKAELVAVAIERGVDVDRADGRTDLDPTVADYRRALG